MAKDPEPHDTTSRWKTAGWWSLGWLALIGTLALIGLIVAWSGHPNTLRYEFAKTCMQVLAVAFFGALATIATFTFQRARIQEAEKNEQRMERRRRQDHELRSIMEETLAAYNRVKRIRRLLGAETSDGYLTLAVYDKHMPDLIDQQLVFERLKRLPPFIRDERISFPPDGEAARPETTMETQTLAETYEYIEKYLNNRVSDEYEKKRHIVRDDVRVPLVTFSELWGFIGHEFVTNVSNRMDEVVKKLLKAFWQPLGQNPQENTPPPDDEKHLAHTSPKWLSRIRVGKRKP